MQEVAHILDAADESSLVLVDELGRATATADGLAVCWSVCESLIADSIPCIFATHLHQMAELPAMYPQAKLWKLDVHVQGKDLTYTWDMQPAQACDTWSYGLALAANLGFPETLLETAKQVSQLQLQISSTALAGKTGSLPPGVDQHDDDEARAADLVDHAAYQVAGPLMSAATEALHITDTLMDDEACPEGCLDVEVDNADDCENPEDVIRSRVVVSCQDAQRFAERLVSLMPMLVNL